MKLQAQNNAKLPKYAAALMCLSFVPALAGCGIVQPDGMMEVYTEPESSAVELDGEIAVQEDEKTPAEIFAENSQAVLKQAFAAAGLDDSFTPQTARIYPTTICCHGAWTAVGFHDEAKRVMVCFYDGSAAVNLDDGCKSVPECNTLDEFYAHFAEKTFDWGYAENYTADYNDVGAFRTAFVDISKTDTLTAEAAAQILSDLLAAYPGEEGTT